ncbi:MAG: tRNA (adenosine(37)-N6)-threonylcarbamoyltransferase complex transferase subunit TsaD [Candidatus Omnitrophica bacterium]|nr:tRNA (adenosine(37)-N6)-threonylcarbamoyltransferase complex transferase subunit TsaD [Candidatus Omnitrophota bacterium]
MLILGIETSCDDTGAAVVRDGREVLSNPVSSQIEIHRPFGGVVPEIASRAHVENLAPLVRMSLQEAGVSLTDLDAVAVTYGPGLAGCLLAGVSLAKSLAYSLHKPLIGVNHLEAHVYTSALDRSPEDAPPFPHLSLLVSGGHTSLYRIDSWMRLARLGGTRDDAAGEAFDKVAKALNLGYPGGPAIQKRADGFDGDWIEFPRPMLSQGLEFSFSGLKTAVINYLRENPIDDEQITRIAASFQRAAVDVLATKTLRAAEQFNLRSISLVGGVSANEALRRELTERARQAGCDVFIPDKKYSMDNGAMAAGLAYHYVHANRFADLTLNAAPGLR